MRYLTTADTDALAVSRARSLLPPDFPEIRCFNLSTGGDVEEWLRSETEAMCIVRLLGGRRAWPDGFDRLRQSCIERGVPFLAFSGEAQPDAELLAASTAPAGLVAEAFEYLCQGGVDNVANFFRFVADTLLNEGYGFDAPLEMPQAGLYRPDWTPAVAPGTPTIGVVFYRAHALSGNTEFVDVLCDEIRSAGGDPLPVYCYSLRPDEDGNVPALGLLDGKVDGLIVTVLASGASASSVDWGEWTDWQVPSLSSLGVPVVQGVCAATSRQQWQESAAGLRPLDVATQVAIPEFDGRVISAAFSFKEPLGEGSDVLVYRADPERARRVAGIAVRLARLRHVPNDEKRIAILLSNYPSKHSRIGNAVGLDTPASATRLLAALRADGYLVEGTPASGDDLIHELIASGGHDPEYLTGEQLRQAPSRVRGDQYAEWFAALPGRLRESVSSKWGDPPGSLYVSDEDIVIAGVRYGNVFVGIQPPRGFGANPVAIYHDPDLPPSHHYLAAYWWLDKVFGADAIVHLGKHGTLEWLPGKSMGLSPACAPDAVLGDLPLFYPFIVNDPGEGTQAKRRAHAVVIDHLVPPMMRAETYDDLARLEQLLDNYAQLQSLDPTKLPMIRAQIWALVRAAELHRDLGVDGEPEAFDDFLRHLDGYLCEIKDVRIKDGLHTLGQPPEGEQRLGLLAAMLRLPVAGGPGLRAAVAGAYGLDEAELLADPAAPAIGPPALLERFGGPSETAGALIDRLEDASAALLAEMDSQGWRPESAAEAAARVLGFGDERVASVLAFAADNVVPRIDRSRDEISNLLAGLAGHYVPSGPSGSPTRGMINVLPTGRNFYSVDPNALPSRLAWDTGQRLADDLLARYLRDEAAYPESVGIVVWGTPAMRTQGDDIGEVLALLGMRPRWDDATQRVTGLEVIPLSELGRPRIDVTIRISGFFRDAFPNLVGLMDDAVRAVAGLEEPEDQNFVAKHARVEREVGGDDRDATTRIFGSKPGAYGAGLLPLIDARNWRTDGDLARVYEVWGGYAYGRGLNGVHAPEAMRRNFSRMRVAVKNADNYEHDLLDSDDYFQYHGGMVALVRALTGHNPRAYIADSADPTSVKTRTLEEEIRRVVRARVINPRWISSMMRHGYKGAFEFSATVDYLFGYDATSGAVDDWMYGAVAQRYVLDPVVANFMRTSNPWALKAITERLLEAEERGLWADADARITDELRQTLLDLDARLEPDG
ncbi:MAG: cobaltochelatase subunit CobN [Chloroflexi bacterium]|nr:cobaltochelatase subunit CobN [Chloroflexota bacterium]